MKSCEQENLHLSEVSAKRGLWDNNVNSVTTYNLFHYHIEKITKVNKIHALHPPSPWLFYITK